MLVFLDVNGLKQTNDLHGHAAGDRLLKLVAETVRQHTRSYDLLVRYGGDEFLCGLLDLTEADATARFDRINQALATHGASITAGFAQPVESESLQDLIARADDSMYRQRKAGGLGASGRGGLAEPGESGVSALLRPPAPSADVTD